MSTDQREALISFGVEVEGEQLAFVGRQLELPPTPKNAKRGYFEIPYVDVNDYGVVSFFIRSVEQSGGYWDEQIVEDALSRVDEEPELALLNDDERDTLRGILSRMSETLEARSGWFHVVLTG